MSKYIIMTISEVKNQFGVSSLNFIVGDDWSTAFIDSEVATDISISFPNDIRDIVQTSDQLVCIYRDTITTKAGKRLRQYYLLQSKEEVVSF